MKKAYPASDTDKHVLKNAPRATHCLPCKNPDMAQNLCNTVVFLWFRDGTGCWYHLKSARDGMLFGYVLGGDWWHYRPIRQEQVFRYF